MNLYFNGKLDNTISATEENIVKIVKALKDFCDNQDTILNEKQTYLQLYLDRIVKNKYEPFQLEDVEKEVKNKSTKKSTGKVTWVRKRGLLSIDSNARYSLTEISNLLFTNEIDYKEYCILFLSKIIMYKGDRPTNCTPIKYALDILSDLSGTTHTTNSNITQLILQSTSKLLKGEKLSYINNEESQFNRLIKGAGLYDGKKNFLTQDGMAFLQSLRGKYTQRLPQQPIKTTLEEFYDNMGTIGSEFYQLIDLNNLEIAKELYPNLINKLLMGKTIIAQKSKLTDFVLSVFKELNTCDSLKAFEKFAEIYTSNRAGKTVTKIKLVSKSFGEKLVGLFLVSTPSDVQKRNKDHIRWYNDKFSIKGQDAYLSNQWNGVGDYDLTYTALRKYVNECYGSMYEIDITKDNSNTEYTLYKIGGIDGQIKEKNVDEDAHAGKRTCAQIPFDIASALAAINKSGLIYSENLIKRYVYSLQTKPFVILSGLAGSGKTQLALAFAKTMVEDEDKQLCMVSVGADWTNREPLLGYPNALVENSYVHPENGVLDLLIECNKEENKDKPFFLILDEMNLSYVERYFADFLSAMESHKAIPLWQGCKEESLPINQDGNKITDDTPTSVALPKNLFIIGTINVDETTYMFSPKVLDRANVIEFKISEQDMNGFLDTAPSVNIESVNGMCVNMSKDFVEIASSSKVICTEANEELKKFFAQLKSVNAEFGYRTATEIGRFLTLAKDELGIEEAIDAAIVQKLLPKLHGSRKKMLDVLKALYALCVKDSSLSNIEKAGSIEESDYKYPVSADKIARMYRIAIDNGYTSFAEA